MTPAPMARPAPEPLFVPAMAQIAPGPAPARSAGQTFQSTVTSSALPEMTPIAAAPESQPKPPALPVTPELPTQAAPSVPAIPAEDPKTAIAPEPAPETDSADGADPALAEFLAQHPEQGKLRVQAFRGPQAIPVEGVKVTVSRDFDGQPYVFFTGETDISGILDGIVLPAAARDASMSPDQPQPLVSYRLTAEHPMYEPLSTTVDIYENVKTIQLVQLRLRSEG